MGTRLWLLATALLGVFTVLSAAAPPSQTTIDRLPRPAVQTPAADKVAMILATKDAEFHQQADGCRVEAGKRGFEYRVRARRLLESATLYSVEIATSWYCGGTYPESYATALTFDLRTGMPYDLNRAFHVGTSHLADAALPILANYMKLGTDCAQFMSKEDLQRADISLGVTKTYLIFYFAVDHALAACYPPVQVPFAALASVADQSELQKLGPPFAVKKAAVCPGVMVVGSDNEVALAMVARGSAHAGFVSSSTEKLRECPSARPECRLQSFLVPGDAVLAGDRVGDFRCVTFRSATGRETSGFLPIMALLDEPAPSPALADWTGRWIRDEEASITIAVNGAAVSVKGDATWGALDPERVRRGEVNTGEINATTTPRGNLLAIGSGYDGTSPPDTSKADDCRARLRLFGPYLAVDDNTGCGGMNVSFTGVYSHRP